MSAHRRRFHILSILIPLSILFSGLAFAPASAQGPDHVKRQFDPQKGKIGFTGPGHGKVPSALLGGIWYVATTGLDSNSCSSAGSPCQTVNVAIGKAANGDTIKLAIGTYTGSGAEVVLINKNVTISGGWNTGFSAQNGQSTIDGQGTRRGVTVNNGAVATMQRLIVQNGNANFGGGLFIDVGATLTINDSMISDNMADWGGGGIFININVPLNNQGGTLTLNNSIVSDNKVGITNYGTLTINNSSISGNEDLNVGGISNDTYGILTINNSVVSDNTGIGIASSGALTISNSTISNNTRDGIRIGSGTLILNNSTVSGNTGTDYGLGFFRGGGIVIGNTSSADSAAATVNNSTITGNRAERGGGIYNIGNATITLKNTIVAGNSSVTSGPDCYGSISSAGYNLIGNTSGCTFASSTGDLTNTNPKLGALTGAPAYHSLAADSPAVNAGNPAIPGSGGHACLATDERGIVRPVGARCDIGAYEYTVPGSAVDLEIVGGDGQQVYPGQALPVPLQVAALDSQGSPVPNVSVTFTAPDSGASGTFTDTGTGTTTILTNANGIAAPLGFTTNAQFGSYTIVASVNGLGSVNFNLRNSAWYVATTGSDANDCRTAVTPCATIKGVLDKPAFSAGGKIRVAEGTYTYTGIGDQALLINKDVSLSGGWNSLFRVQTGMSTVDGEGEVVGVRVKPGISATIERFVVQNGAAEYTGGGIENDGTLVLNNSLIRNNTCCTKAIYGISDGGGGIGNRGMLTINNSTITGNSSVEGAYNFFGGGLLNYNGTLILNNSTVSGNRGGIGGGLFSYSTVVLNNSTITGNISSAYGGGLFFSNDGVDTITFTMQNTLVAGNSATDTGPDCWSRGTISSAGYNLIGDGSFCSLSAATGDLVGTANQLINPHLTPLQDNGGPTLTHALMIGSPALDAGNPLTPGSQESACLATDQRGVTRPQGSHCDIGAYEAGGLVDIRIGGAAQASYQMDPGHIKRVRYQDVNRGPVQILHRDDDLIVAAERVIYKVDNVLTSFSEMMGLPDSQLDNTYWLPWYNNVDLDTQLRIANVNDFPATVQIWIGDSQVTGSPFTLPAGESMRRSFPNVNGGPVKIVSDLNIVAAERLIYKANGVATSFSEMMALPNQALDTSYWLPWYNNVELDTQLRFANVTDQTASVHVYIGGSEMTGSPFTLLAGESTRKSFAGINAGPVQIVSDHGVPIVAAERVIYKANGVNTSFTEMMALPNSQLDNTYWLPWYNNAELDTQLRFANVTDQTATVHVYIGGNEMTGSPFTLLPGASTRKSFGGVNAGPVQIVSDLNIVAAERVIYKVNGLPTSFSEMMALPTSQLDTTYWLPWYNNVDLDTQLRFGVP